MPQLDVLTYFSQFIYLLISIIAVYVCIHTTVIPKIVTAQKLRTKVNSVAYLTAHNTQAVVDTPAYDNVSELRSSKWFGSTHGVPAWPRSARMQQYLAAQGFKKRLCGLILLRV